MLASAVIVFREMLEAGLVVVIVLAATKGVPGRALSVVRGVIAGAIGACLVAAFAGQLGSLFQGSGQELFDAAVLLLAVVMLVWHNAWMAGHGRSIADEARRMGAAVRAGRRPLVALSFVCGVALLREGSESVLFLYGVAVSGDSSRSSMVAGGAIGFLAAAALAAVLYLGLLSIPVRHVFSVTTALIALLAAGLASQSVAFLQQAGRMEVLTSTVWDSSRLLPEDGWPGRVLHSLVGYTDRPSGAQVVAYLLTIAVMVATMRIAGWRTRRAALSAAPPVRHDDPTAVRDA